MFVYLLFSAYIWGEKGGLLPEHPCRMGESLNGTPGLDIETEIMVANEEVKRLRSEQASEAAITNALKDFGLKRFVIVIIFFFKGLLFIFFYLVKKKSKQLDILHSSNTTT